MKRPQSAKHQIIGNWPQISSEEVTALENESLRNIHGKKSGNILRAHYITNSNDFSRLLPKKIMQDKERLYSEGLQLKQNLNQVLEENTRLKTKVSILEKERQKFRKIGELGSDVNSKSGSRLNNYLNPYSTKQNQKQNMIIFNLKKIVRESKEENEYLSNQLTKIKKSIKYTKINELELQIQMLIAENKRISGMFDEVAAELTQKRKDAQSIDTLKKYLEEEIQQNNTLEEQIKKYEQIVADFQNKLKAQKQKYTARQTKYQRQLAVEKRKAAEALRNLDRSSSELKALKEQLGQAIKLKDSRKIQTRPASSHPYLNVDNSHRPVKEKSQIQSVLMRNQQLNNDLKELKDKLKISESELNKVKKSATQQQNSKYQEEIEYKSDFEQNSKIMEKYSENTANQPKNKVRPLSSHPIKKNKNEVRESNDKSGLKEEKTDKTFQILKQTLTYRLRCNRYTFQELKKDIQSSGFKSFALIDLKQMLFNQPFYLNNEFVSYFLSKCYQKPYEKIKETQKLDVKILLANLRKSIGDFNLPVESEEIKTVQRLQFLVSKHEYELFEALTKYKIGREDVISKQNFKAVLSKYKQLTAQDIQFAISQLSIISNDIDHLEFNDFLRKYYADLSQGNEPIQQQEHEESQNSMKKKKSSVIKIKSQLDPSNFQEIDKELSLGENEGYKFQMNSDEDIMI